MKYIFSIFCFFYITSVMTNNVKASTLKLNSLRTKENTLTLIHENLENKRYKVRSKINNIAFITKNKSQIKNTNNWEDAPYIDDIEKILFLDKQSDTAILQIQLYDAKAYKVIETKSFEVELSEGQQNILNKYNENFAAPKQHTLSNEVGNTYTYLKPTLTPKDIFIGNIIFFSTLIIGMSSFKEDVKISL